jgi:hypothetical protein
VARHRLATGVCDFTSDVIGWGVRRARAVDVTAGVGDDHACASGGQQQCMGAPNTAPGSGHDDSPVIES